MSLEERVREHFKETDNSSLMAEIGITQEQSVEVYVRSARCLWIGFQIGSFVTLGVILMLLGGWALWRFFAR